MTLKKRPACALDLDGTLNHAVPVPGGAAIRGRTTDSFLSPETLACLARLSRKIDIVVATGRSRNTAADFRAAFTRWGVRIAGWIFEHGAAVQDRPEWTRTVLAGIDIGRVRRAVGRMIRERGLPIDDTLYVDSHDHILLLSGKGPLLAEHFIACAADVLGDDFRSIVGRRKIALIPKRADKFAAFNANFGTTHFLAFAAGDQPDDLTLLEYAVYPLTHAGADPIMCRYVRSRKGYVAESGGHMGTAALLDEILRRLSRQRIYSLPEGKTLPGTRLPVEEAHYFRPSRRAYLDRLFVESVVPETSPDLGFLEQLGRRLVGGQSLVLEVGMRDWGGEVKPLKALLSGFIPYLPLARWRLWFRKERRGAENLADFRAITRRLGGMAWLPDGRPRFSAPGVPGSPPDPGPPNATLLLFDHPEDLGSWYTAAMPRLITRHPIRPGIFWVNPMYLKISGPTPGTRRIFTDQAIRVMMAANVVDKTDIGIAVSGFRKLRDQADALIIAPRVVTNPSRNRMIRDAISAIGETAAPLSRIGPEDRPGVIVVDTYGDLPGLYAQCRFSYLGGGFDPRKRGFDPVESLRARVPVIMGPLCDYNRIAVNLLAGTGWITRLAASEATGSDMAEAVRRRMSDKPDPAVLEKFFRSRTIDSLQVALEVMAHLAGVCLKGYLLPEHRVFPMDRILPSELTED